MTLLKLWRLVHTVVCAGPWRTSERNRYPALFKTAGQLTDKRLQPDMVPDWYNQIILFRKLPDGSHICTRCQHRERP